MFAFKWHLNIHMKKCDGMLRIRKSKKKSKKANYKIVTNEEGKMFQCIVWNKIVKENNETKVEFGENILGL